MIYYMEYIYIYIILYSLFIYLFKLLFSVTKYCQKKSDVFIYVSIFEKLLKHLKTNSICYFFSKIFFL